MLVVADQNPKLQELTAVGDREKMRPRTVNTATRRVYTELWELRLPENGPLA